MFEHDSDVVTVVKYVEVNLRLEKKEGFERCVVERLNWIQFVGFGKNLLRRQIGLGLERKVC